MSAIRLIKDAASNPLTTGSQNVTICRERAEFKSQMVMTRFHVDKAIEDDDRERAEYIYSQLIEQSKKLSRKFGFSMLS
jgi:hypothetical protein